MPATRMDLRMIKEVLRLKLDARLSHEQVARALRVSKGVVAKYVGLAGAAGLNEWTAIRELDERALQVRLLSRGPKTSSVVMPDFARMHRELSRKGVTLMLLFMAWRGAQAGGDLSALMLQAGAPGVGRSSLSTTGRSRARCAARCARCTWPARSCS